MFETPACFNKCNMKNSQLLLPTVPISSAFSPGLYIVYIKCTYIVLPERSHQTTSELLCEKQVKILEGKSFLLKIKYSQEAVLKFTLRIYLLQASMKRWEHTWRKDPCTRVFYRWLFSKGCVYRVVHHLCKRFQST